MTTIHTEDIQSVAKAIDRLAAAVEQGVLAFLDKSTKDPYPQSLEPAAEFGDLPPVRPTIVQGNGAGVCPIHNTPWRTVPAGTSKKTGRAYDAFQACSTAGCDQRPPR